MAFPDEDEDQITETNDQEIEDSGQEERDVDVSDKEGKTEVEVHHESRRERKKREFAAQRQREIDDALAPINRQNDELRRQLSELTTLLRNQPAHQQPTVQHQQQSDDIDPDFDAIKRKQADLIRRARTAKSDEEAEEIEREYRKLEQKAYDIRAEKVADRKLAGYKPPAQMNYQEQQLRAEFSDVFADPDAEMYARGLVIKAEVAAKRRGQQVNPMKIRQDALMQTAHDLGIRKPPAVAPKPSQVARLSNRSGNAGQARQDRSVKRTLTSDERKAAIASGDPELSAEQNIARWTKKMESLGYWENE